MLKVTEMLDNILDYVEHTRERLVWQPIPNEVRAHFGTAALAAPMLKLLAPVALNIVCFRYRGEDANRLNANIVADLQESGIVAPSTTMIDGHLAIRAAIVNHRTDERDIDSLINATVAFGDAQLKNCAA